MPEFVTLSKGWDTFNKDLRNLETKFNHIIGIIIRRELLKFQGMVKRGIKNQAPGGKRFKPLSAWTLALRKFRGFRGTKALIVSGDLRNSIVTEYSESKKEGFVGILYQTKSKDGKSMVNIAEIQEYGTKPFAVKRTPKMRKFLAMVASKSGLISYSPNYRGKGVYIIKIPARPFIAPTFEAWKKGLEQRIFVSFGRAIRQLK